MSMRALSGFFVAAFHRIKATYAHLRARRRAERTRKAPPV